jgi:hypothetical protein
MQAALVVLIGWLGCGLDKLEIINYCSLGLVWVEICNRMIITVPVLYFVRRLLTLEKRGTRYQYNTARLSTRETNNQYRSIYSSFWTPPPSRHGLPVGYRTYVQYPHVSRSLGQSISAKNLSKDEAVGRMLVRSDNGPS